MTLGELSLKIKIHMNAIAEFLLSLGYKKVSNINSWINKELVQIVKQNFK